MRNSLFVVLATTGLFATQAMAQDYGNIYVGIGAGKTNLKTSVSASGTDVSGTVKTDDDASTGFVFLGYTFNPFISIEGGITTTTDAKGNGAIDGATVGTSTSMRAFEVVAKGTIPIGKFEVFARGGAIYGDTDYDLTVNIQDSTVPSFSNPNRVTASYQDTGLILGLGVGYNFGRGAIRLQYDYTTMELGGTSDYALTKSTGGTSFEQFTAPLEIKTDNPTRLMLTVSGYF